MVLMRSPSASTRLVDHCSASIATTMLEPTSCALRDRCAAHSHAWLNDSDVQIGPPYMRISVPFVRKGVRSFSKHSTHMPLFARLRASDWAARRLSTISLTAGFIYISLSLVELRDRTIAHILCLCASYISGA